MTYGPALDRLTLKYIRESAFRSSIFDKWGGLYFKAVRDSIAAGDIAL